jgi:hypothetical protein
MMKKNGEIEDERASGTPLLWLDAAAARREAAPESDFSSSSKSAASTKIRSLRSAKRRFFASCFPAVEVPSTWTVVIVFTFVVALCAGPSIRASAWREAEFANCEFRV